MFQLVIAVAVVSECLPCHLNIEGSGWLLKSIRIALEGCYPSFWSTDLVIRAMRCCFMPQLVGRLEPHDLLVRGPFADGSKRRRLVNKTIRTLHNARLFSYQPATLHVCSENHSLENYQSFEQSHCDFGIGHELITSPSYFRLPHWHNYLDLSSIGIVGPDQWPRLGNSIQVTELSNPIKWNSSAPSKAVFVTSNMTRERFTLMTELSKLVPIQGYGKAFDSSIPDHLSSGFLKRDLLKDYKYCFCPENSLAPGYYTEKVPESYISGAIPITYCDPGYTMDFSSDSLINLERFFDGRTFDISSFEDFFHSTSSLERLLCTPLVSYDLFAHASLLKEFVSDICAKALS